jgi:hypothetical protein
VIVQPTNPCAVPCLTNDPLYSAYRYYNRSSAQVFLAIHQPNILCTLLCLATLQPTIPFALSVDTTTDYPFCSLWCYYNRLSALPTIRSVLSGATPTDYPICNTLSDDTVTNYLLYSAHRNYNRLSAAPSCLSILQLTVYSTDYLLCSLWRYSNRLSAVLFSVW